MAYPFQVQFRQFFSVDSPKAIKAQGFGYLNAINYMAPHKSGGVGNLCSHASPSCIALCLGKESGRAAIAVGSVYPVRESRKRKAQFFMGDRQGYMREMLLHIARLVRRARNADQLLAVRPNGSTDIAYEGVRVVVTAEFAAQLSEISGAVVTAGIHTIFSAFPAVQFLDYTKNPHRITRALPSNYYLTFSLSEINRDDALRLLALGHNVAVVFGHGLPASWQGYRVIDGDEHDLRHLDARGGFVIGLSPKGHKAKRDKSGFVLRDYDRTELLLAA